MRDDLRIAVTGASGAAGQAVRAALAERKIPAERVRLLDRPAEEAILTEYAGHPALIGPLDPDAFADRDLVFLCGSAGESEACLLWRRRADAVIVDLSGASAARGSARIVNMAVNGSDLDAATRVVAAPHPMALALSTALAPLDQAAGIAEASAVVLRPVSDFGEPGVEELHAQTVSLLNFGAVPKAVFGHQVAFNLLPHASLADAHEEGGLPERLGVEVDGVLGGEPRRTSVRLLLAPIFHGHAATVHLRLRRAMDPAELRRGLGRAKRLGLAGASRRGASPVEASPDSESLTVDLAPDGVREEGVWLSLVGTRLPEGAARNALEIAARLLSG